MWFVFRAAFHSAASTTGQRTLPCKAETGTDLLVSITRTVLLHSNPKKIYNYAMQKCVYIKTLNLFLN